jgi:cbb3-type cytochrome oxidase cytochrome c subunit
VAAEKLPPKAVAGAQLFATSGCESCHTYVDSGTTNLGGQDLTSEGLKGRGLDWQIRHLRCPSCVVKGSQMPKFGLGEPGLHALASFLEASKGER